MGLRSSTYRDDEVLDFMDVVDAAEVKPTEGSPRPGAVMADRRVIQQTRLKHVLKAADLLALGVGWAFAGWLVVRTGALASPPHALAVGAIATISAVLAMASKRLWLARVCAIRSMEMERLGEVTLISGLLALGAISVFNLDVPSQFVFAGAFSSLSLLIIGRTSYRAWLASARRRGRFTRGLVVVGANAEAAHIAKLIQDHPQNGFSIAGVCGPENAVARLGIDAKWLGEYEDADAAVASTDANGALVIASAFDHLTLNRLLRQLLRAGSHVHVANGIRGIAHGRLRKMPFEHEPLFYLESTCLTRPQLMIKRCLDVVISASALVLAAPVLVLAAVAIKVEDHGPLLFRQKRVGRGDDLFTLYKLRTMVVGAEAQQSRLAAKNGRTGPLFKVAGDPRVTRVGKVLRALSLDELPQLVNVLQGHMSLVGPRPALPAEVEQFDEELRERGRMLPGITGLWQVEGRDDPSFDSYRRLDLFYVENWSVGLDLSILLATMGVVIPRGIRVLTSKAEFA